MTQNNNQLTPVEYRMSSDKMVLTMTIAEGPGNNQPINPVNILAELDRMRVEFGIDHKAIESSINLYNNSGTGTLNLVIAKGIRVVHGKSGHIEWLIKKPDFSVKIEPDGTIDFHEIDTFTRVKKQQPILRNVPPVPGIAGKDIFGEVIPAKEGNPVTLPEIKNTAVSQNDPDVLISQIDGCVHFIRNSIEISSLLEISGDVDFSTGNVRFDGSVKIDGDVRSGFEVSAEGSIEINGAVENAVLRAKGDITIKGGFVGTGKGLIESGGNVTVGYVRNQQIEAKGSIFIRKEAVSCRLSSQDKIIISGKLIGFAGGTAFALKGVDAVLLGSKTGVKTEINAGIDPQILASLNDLNSQLEVLKEQSSKLELQMFGIKNARIQHKAIFNKLFEKIEIIKKDKITIDKTIKELLQKKQSLETSYKDCADPRIRVTGIVYPGTTLALNGIKKLVEKPQQRCFFYQRNGKVLNSPLV